MHLRRTWLSQKTSNDEARTQWIQPRPRRPRHLVLAPPSGRTRRSAGRSKTPELKYYYPTSVLCTSRDIITLWVARMVLTGLYNLRRGSVPPRLHPPERSSTASARRCRKSKGNGVDPLDIIDRYGADALRFGMVHLATENAGQPDAGGERLPALRDAGAGEARAHVHADEEADVPAVARSRSAPAGRGRPTTRNCTTAKQALGTLRARPQLRQQALERRPVHADEPGRLHARRRSIGRAADRGPLDSQPAGDDGEWP